MFKTDGRADQHGIPSFVKELNDDFQWVDDNISERSEEDSKNELFRMIDIVPNGYNRTMSGLFYGALTVNFQTFYDYIGDFDKDGYDHIISQLKKVVRYKCFSLYSRETIHRIMLLIENLVTDHRSALDGIPGLYDVCESILRQIRGGDISETNVWLSNEVLEFFQRELIWLYNNERLLHITFYTFTSLIRDHHEPMLENLRAKEIKFCKMIFDVHFNSFFKIGRDLLRLIRDNRNVTEFLYVLSMIPEDIKITIMKQKTLSYCLTSRLSYDMSERLTHMLEQHSLLGFKRKLDFFKTNFLTPPADPRFLIADIIRWIVSAYRPNSEKAMSNRYLLINLLLHEIGGNWDAIELAKTALVYDWLCFERNNRDPNVIKEGLYCIENVKTNSLRIAKDLLEALYTSISNIFPGIDNELRENIRASSQIAIARNIMTVEDIKIIRTKLSDFVGDNRIVKIVGDLWGHLMNTMPVTPSVFPSNPLQADLITGSPFYQQSTSLPFNQSSQTSIQSNLFLDNQLINSKKRELSVDSAVQPSNPVSKSLESKPVVEETSSNLMTNFIPSTRVSASLPSNSVEFGRRNPTFDANIGSFYEVKLDATNSPHLTDLPSFIGPDICRTLNFDELNKCFNLNSECLEINPSKQNLFNCLISWVFNHKDEKDEKENNSPKFKSFEMYRLIVKNDEKTHSEARIKLLVYCLRSLKLDKLGSAFIKDFKLLINLYLEYINYEVKREGSHPDVEEEVNKRFLSGIQLLQQYECNVFDSIVPKLLQIWPEIFVGNFEFITSIIHGINPMLIYKFETDLRLGHYRVFGDLDLDYVLENSLNCWGSFEQLYLFQLIKAEVGNNTEKLENFICSSVQLKFLEPIEHPESLCGLLSLLELIPPTAKSVSFLTKLIANAKLLESKLENLKFVASVFTRWNDSFPEKLIEAMTDEVSKNIKESENDENEASDFFDVIAELWKNEKLKQGSAVGKEIVSLQRSPEAEDDGDQMEVDDGDDPFYDQPTTAVSTISTRSKGKAKQLEVEDRSKRSTGPYNNNRALRQKTDASSEGESSSHEKTQNRKGVKPKRAKRKNNRQTRKRLNIASHNTERRKSISSGGEEPKESKMTGRGARSKSKNNSALNRSETSRALSVTQTSINRRKSISGSGSKKRSAKDSSDE
ncbi:2994_t:CDS:10 [Funneliformis mosseae]|uniref:2994_t:CDS:1 n=1 Tax=Funneliformis mosseae TaxID=27381 RepID=A0A9N8VEU4_FUNMO|nr:2994_t:CDS:10 [Funneliformis mosseae]